MAVKKKVEDKPSEEMKTYVMHLPNKKMRQITVPADWKVTFGPLIPPGQARQFNERTFALRFYEGPEKQRAVFTDVLSFYEKSIPLEDGKVDSP